MPISTYYAVTSRSYNDGNDQASDGFSSPIDTWQSDNGLGQGRYLLGYDNNMVALYDGPFYGTFHFGSGAEKPSELSGKIIDSVRLRITRYDDSPGSSSGVTTTVYATNLTSVPGSGAHSPDGQVTGSGTTSPSMTKGQQVWFAIPVALAQAVIAGKCLCLYTGNGRLSRHYGIENATYKPAIEITWHEPAPSITSPSISAISPITANNATFDFSDAVDTSGYFPSAQLSYEMQISVDGGTSWRTTVYASAQGVSQITIANLRVAGVLQDAALQAAQYYYNTQCKIRVRAKTPLWGDPAQNYYSIWVVSAAFTVNYKIVPSVPTSLVPSKVNPYEGEAITLTVGRPASYNSHNHLGAVMGMTYAVELEGAMTLATGSADVSNTSKVLNYTVGNLTSGNDRPGMLRAKATDAEGQISPYLMGVDFTIRRFRAPLVTATISGRTATGCTVNLVVTDTGYGGTQLSSQIQKIEYKGVPGATDWTLAPIGTWGGAAGAFTNSFVLSNLVAGNKYTLKIRATNYKPVGTSLYDLNGLEYERNILEYLPRLAAFKRNGATGNQASAGGYAQSFVVGENPDAPVNKGCANIQFDINIGGNVNITGTLNKGGVNILSLAHPVGSIYLSAVNINPSTFFGGTWTAWGTGRVPVAIDTGQTEFNTVEKTGGAKIHTLLTTEMPSHTHSLDRRTGTPPSSGGNGNFLPYAASTGTDYVNGAPVNASGGGGAHNNLQPYITCYMWKRTA